MVATEKPAPPTRRQQVAVRERRQQRGPDARNHRAPEELQPLEPFDGRVLERTGARDEPAHARSNQPEHQPARRGEPRRIGQVHDEPDQHEDRRVAGRRQDAEPPGRDDAPEDVKLHRDEVLGLVLVPDEHLVELGRATLAGVRHAEEQNQVTGREPRPAHHERDQRSNHGADDNAALVSAEAFVRGVLVHAPGGDVRAGEQADNQCSDKGHGVDPDVRTGHCSPKPSRADRAPAPRRLRRQEALAIGAVDRSD